MIMRYADPFDALFAFQQALENRFSSDWLGGTTAGMGSYPPINVFQQGDDLVAIIELPGINKEELNIQAKGKHHPDRRPKALRLPRRCEPTSAGTAFRGLRPYPRGSDANRA